MASSVCCVVYASQPKLRVQSSLASWMLGARGVQVTDLIGAGQQVPGHVPQPGGGVDQVRGAAEGGDLREDAVDGGLQGDLQVAEVSCRGRSGGRGSPCRARRGGRPAWPVRPGRPSRSGRTEAPWRLAGPRRPRFAGRPRRWPAGPPRSSAHRSPRPWPRWRCWSRRCWSSSLLSSGGSPA